MSVGGQTFPEWPLHDLDFFLLYFDHSIRIMKLFHLKKIKMYFHYSFTKTNHWNQIFKRNCQYRKTTTSTKLMYLWIKTVMIHEENAFSHHVWYHRGVPKCGKEWEGEMSKKVWYHIWTVPDTNIQMNVSFACIIQSFQQEYVKMQEKVPRGLIEGAAELKKGPEPGKFWKLQFKWCKARYIWTKYFLENFQKNQDFLLKLEGLIITVTLWIVYHHK